MRRSSFPASSTNIVSKPVMLMNRIHGSHRSKVCGVLRSRRQQVQRHQPRRDADAAEQSRTVFADHNCSVHVYHSLSRCHSLTQNMSMRTVKGTLP